MAEDEDGADADDQDDDGEEATLIGVATGSSAATACGTAAAAVKLLDELWANLIGISVLIELSPDQVKGGSTPLLIGVYSGDKKLQTIKTGFVGPRDDTGK